MNLFQKLKSADQLKVGAFLSYLVIGLNSLVGLAYTPYMLRMMGQSEYGLYSLVGSVVAYLTILDFGIGNAIVRYTAKFRAENKSDEQHSMFGLFIIIYTIIGLCAFLIGLVLYYNVDLIFGDTLTPSELEKAKIMVLLMNFNIGFTFPLSIFSSIITAYERFIFQKTLQVIRILLNTVTMIALLELGYRATGMVVVITFYNLSTLLINFWYCRREIGIKIKFSNFDFTLLREVLVYSFFIFLNIIMDKIYWSTGQFVLGAFVGTSAIAVFAVAIKLQQMYMSFSTAISSVFLPKITAITTKSGTEREISDLFIKTGRVQYIILAFILCGFLLFGKTFIEIWAGSEYSDAYIITVIIFIPLTVPLIQNLGISILQARNQLKFRSIAYIFIAIFSLIIQIPLAKHYNGIGVAIGISIGLFLGQVVVMNIYYSKVQQIQILKFWKEIGKMSIAPAIYTLVFSVVLNHISTNSISSYILQILIYSTIYIPVFWYTTMNTFEKNLILRPINKILESYK